MNKLKAKKEKISDTHEELSSLSSNEPSHIQSFLNIVLGPDWETVSIDRVTRKIYSAKITSEKNTSKSKIAPEKTIVLYFLPSEMDIDSFSKILLRKLNLKETELKDSDSEMWGMIVPESEQTRHFALSKLHKIGGIGVVLYTENPGLDSIKAAVLDIENAMNSSFSMELLNNEIVKLKPSWIGPGVGAIVFLSEALMLFLASSPVYHFGRTQSAGIPNKFSSIFFAVLSVFFILRYIRPGYLFILLTEGLTIAQIIIGAVFPGRSIVDSSFHALIITAMHIFLLIFIPFRAKDFNIFSFKEFFHRVFK
ncbi:MAG: hypothetical protein JXR95_03655 [Deltaproteobacteria bacterium]|nr:hypothetical protein [Deltaproteobacteria bacterium]